MKYEDIDNVENQIINNDYVSYDVKPARKSRQFFEKIKGSFNKEGTGSLLILPLMALTAISTRLSDCTNRKIRKHCRAYFDIDLKK